MASERNAFRLGLTMILFFVLLLGVLYFLAPRGGGDMTLHVRFPHTRMTTALKPGAPVRCGGSTVGAVRSLDLVEVADEDLNAMRLDSVITIRVQSQLGLRDDCVISPQPPLLGGGGQLVVEDRGVGSPLRDGDTVAGRQAASLNGLMDTLAAQLDPRDPASLLAMLKGQLDPSDRESLMGKVHRSLDDINAMTQAVSYEFDPQEKAALLAKLHGIMDEVNVMTHTLRTQLDPDAAPSLAAKVHEILDTLQGGLRSAVAMIETNREPISETVAHVRNTSEILERRIAAQIARQLDPSDAAGLLAKIHVAIDRLGASLADVRAVTSNTREVVALTKGQIQNIISNFEETSIHLKATSKDVRANPWLLLYQPKPEEVAKVNALSMVRAFTDAATRVDSAIERLEALKEAEGELDLTEDEDLMAIRDRLQQSFEEFKSAEQALWKKLKIE